MQDHEIRPHRLWRAEGVPLMVVKKVLTRILLTVFPAAGLTRVLTGCVS
jgi:hypothetical protein